MVIGRICGIEVRKWAAAKGGYKAALAVNGNMFRGAGV